MQRERVSSALVPNRPAGDTAGGTSSHETRMRDDNSPPSAFCPGDRVRIRFGMFAGLVGEVIGPLLDRPEDSVVRLAISGREIEAPVSNWMLEAIPPQDGHRPS